jgi:uronate dehydrogenase
MVVKRVLVTGSAGAIGRVVAKALIGRGHQVRGFDRVPSPDLPDHRVGDLTDAAILGQAMAGIDTVVQLAATPDRADFVGNLVPNNIVGPYRLFEAACAAGVKRVIFASSCRVVDGLYRDHEAVRVEEGFAPGDHYALTKACGELMAGMYARRKGLSVICVRIGWFIRNRDEAANIARSAGGQRLYLSHHDAARFFIRAVEVEGVDFATVFLTSRSNGFTAADLEPARQLGYEPEDTYPQGSPSVMP